MRTRFAILTLCLLVPSTLHAEEWTHFRGPNYNGSTSAKNLPTKWSKTENIAWTADLPGASASTPIVSGDRVFVSSTDSKDGTLQAICLERKTGKVQWSHVIGDGISQDYRSTYAAPSPVTDGKLVVFFYGTGQTAVYDLEGKKLWAKNFGPFAFQWTFASSPLLFDGRLYLQILQRDTKVKGRGPSGNPIESYLLALDPMTGKQIFKHIRPSKAAAESREAFSSPIPVTVDGQSQIVIVGGDAITGHDPKSGKEIWRWGTWNPERIGHWRLVPSPVASKDVVLASAPKRNPIYAVKLGGKGTLSDDALAWVSKDEQDITTDVPTPAYAEGDFFVLSDVRRKLSRVEPKTGKVKWTVDTPGRSKYEASPTVADGKVYTINFDGTVAIFSTENGKLLNQIEMGDGKRKDAPIRSSVVVADGQVFVRTNSKLYCVGK